MAGTFDRAKQLAAGPMDGRGLDRGQALELLSLAEQDLQAVLCHAEAIRRRHRGDRVRLCGIVAVKVGRCPEDCAWCSQSARHDARIRPHGLLADDEIRARADEAARNGAGSFGLVASGARPTPDELDRLCAVLGQLDRHGRVSPCASLGMLDDAAARRLAAAWCRRYNHNLETSRAHFANVVTTHTYEQRLATARTVKAAGMELCCGGLFGIGERPEDRVDLALEVRGLDADTVPLNFLNPIPGTQLEAAPPLSPRQCLAVIAMMRFVLPARCIKVAGGRETALRDLQSWMFAAGADGCIVGNYLTTTGRAAEDDLRMIADLALRIDTPSGGRRDAAGAMPQVSENHVH